MPDASARSPFSYVILRVVPNVERGERVNVGVVMFCRQRGFLGARFAVDPQRLRALGDAAPDPGLLAELAERLVG